jgi:hypothetical protein
METKLFARKCSVTGNGMNEGWVWGEGVYYTPTLELTLAECRNDRGYILEGVYKNTPLAEYDTVQTPEEMGESQEALDRAEKGEDTDEDILLIGYHTDYLYSTEWDDSEDVQYQEKEGVLTKIE